MTVPGWDPEKWHAQHGRQHTPPAAGPARKVSPKRIGIAAVVLLLAGAAAVSATHVADDGGGPVGVCHATGSEQNPHVFLVVDKDGYEHGHHRHHDGDFFVDASAGDCAGDPPIDQAAADGNGTVDADNGTEGPSDDGNATAGGANETAAGDAAEDAAGNETMSGNGTEGPAGNETGEPAGNETTDGDAADDPAGNGTADGSASEGPAANETASEPNRPPAPGNVAVEQEASQDQFEVVLSIVVTNTGDALSENVTLADTLPEVYRSWHLGGVDSDACVLDGRDVSCWFGALEPGDSVSIELQAFTDRMPCGYNLNNTAYVSALDDAEGRDNASSAGIKARPC